MAKKVRVCLSMGAVPGQLDYTLGMTLCYRSHNHRKSFGQCRAVEAFFDSYEEFEDWLIKNGKEFWEAHKNWKVEVPEE